jgi:hypothetical protein
VNRSCFEELNRCSRVTFASYFHQRRLRRAHSLPRGFGLCAALVEVWWEAVRDGHAGLAAFEREPSAIVKDLIARQLRSAYLADWPADQASPGTSERALLESKYGTADLRAIADRATALGIETPLALDLYWRFGLRIAQTQNWQHCATAPPIAALAIDEPGLRVLLLRYGASGHRMAFLVEPGGGLRFFDPNAGEVNFSSGADFAAWFELFWNAGGYARRYPNVTFFRFRAHEPATTSIHES